MLAALLLSAGGACAGQFEDAVAAHDRGDYATALRIFRSLAANGEERAQFNVGLIYYNGHGVEQNYEEARNWYRLSAEQGNAEAQYDLGVMYEKGRGGEQDDAEAVRWFRLAANQGYAIAQYHLAVAYAFGDGVKQDQRGSGEVVPTGRSAGVYRDALRSWSDV